MTNTDVGSQWAEELVERVGRTARKVRGKRSAKWLSDRTAELGMRISPTVIAKLDSGHRGANLSVPELFVIAGALGVPPGSLLFPDLPDGEVRRWPNADPWRSVQAVNWIAGETFDTEELTTSPEMGYLMVGSQAREDEYQWLRDAQEDLDKAKADGDVAQVEVAMKVVKRAQEQIDRTEAALRELGGVVSDG